MKRTINRIKKIGLEHLEKRAAKIERRMAALLKEYYACQDAMQYFKKEEMKDAVRPIEGQTGIGGGPTDPNTRPIELSDNDAAQAVLGEQQTGLPTDK